MLLLIISLFSHYDFLRCVDYEKPKFDESLLMKKHHENFVQIKDFIKEAQHKFHEEREVLRVGDNELESTRDDELLNHSITKWWWDKPSSIDQLGLNTLQTFLLPLIKTRTLFPNFSTPYTTEFNNRPLNWDKIFPAQSIYTRPSESRLHIGPDVSIPPKNPRLSQAPQPKDQKTFGPTNQPPKLHIYTRPLHPNTTLRLDTSLSGHSGNGFGPNTTLITPNEEYKKIWLQEITTYTPVERWFKTLATQTGMTPSYDYTTKGDPQLGRTLTKTSKSQALVLNKQLKNDFKNQPPRFLRQGLPLSDTLTEVEDHRYLTASTATAKTAQFFIEDVGGIIDLKTISEKDDDRTKMIDERPVTVPNDGQMKVTPTAADVLRIEQDPETPAKSRRFHLNARKRKRHRNSYKRYKARQTYQKHRYRHPKRNEPIYSYRRRRHHSRGIKKVARPSENRRHKEPIETPNALLQDFERDDTEDEKLIKFIDRSDESVRNTAQKDKTSFYHQIKESLKQAESKKKTKRLKLKAELLRKIVEGSSYSDEEASLTKNLIQALQYGNRTFEHNVAMNSRDTMKRIIR